jgi:hypothetical protein
LELAEFTETITAVVADNEQAFQVFGHGDEQALILVLLNKRLPRVIFFELGDTRNSADQRRFLLQPEGKAGPGQ